MLPKSKENWFTSGYGVLKEWLKLTPDKNWTLSWAYTSTPRTLFVFIKLFLCCLGVGWEKAKYFDWDVPYLDGRVALPCKKAACSYPLVSQKGTSTIRAATHLNNPGNRHSKGRKKINDDTIASRYIAPLYALIGSIHFCRELWKAGHRQWFLITHDFNWN